jgi:hypothetical protein
LNIYIFWFLASEVALLLLLLLLLLWLLAELATPLCCFKTVSF